MKVCFHNLGLFMRKCATNSANNKSIYQSVHPLSLKAAADYIVQCQKFQDSVVSRYLCVLTGRETLITGIFPDGTRSALATPLLLFIV